MRLTRLIGAATLAVAVATPAQAIPDTLGAPNLLQLTIAVPTGGASCTVSVLPPSRVTFTSTGIGVGTALEVGSMRVSSSSGCGSVSWTATATVSDTSPGHPTYTKTAAGFGNPAQASVSQSVPYSLGQREVGVVTFTLAASSRLGDFCFKDYWQVSAFGNPSPIGFNLVGC